MTAGNPACLYVHVPFCRSFCYYCDFRREFYRAEMADRWLSALEKELNEREDFSPRTIYLGGGTPTALNDAQLERLLSLLDRFAKKAEEYTVELNPETMRPGLGSLLARHGVNRVSIGMQSHSNVLLKQMNRAHTAEDAAKAMEQLRKDGISNISLDLLYSLPGQTMRDLSDSIAFALSLKPSHLSLYSLTIEENSVFGRRGIKPLDEDTEADMYEMICARLTEAGYEHYEISNFAKDGKASLHNTLIWKYEDFAGIGYGASGKEQGVRYTHDETLKAYLTDPLHRVETVLSKQEQMFETVMMGLRLRQGISRKAFAARWDLDLTSLYPGSFASLRKKGLLTWNDDYVSCTPRGYEILNTVLEEILEEAEI